MYIMNTITHLLLAVIIRQYVLKNKNIKLPNSFVWGSFAPDILLLFLTCTSFVLYFFTTSMSVSQIMSYIFDTLYFNDPIWIFAYNVLHSPFIIIVCLILLYSVLQNNISLFKTVGKIKKNEQLDLSKYLNYFPALMSVSFFFIGCLFHIALDIPFHYDDGPLLLYPIDNELRFYSPISYWDPNHYGVQFTIFESILLIGLMIYVVREFKIVGKIKRKLKRKT